MGYCFMTIERVSSLTGLQSKAEHNLRLKDTPNADKEKEGLNEELVSFEGKNIVDEWQEKFDELPYYKATKLRKDAIKAMEVVMTMSKEDAQRVNLEKWKKDNLEWLKRTFDVGTEGKSNILSVVYHGDESNAHIHALVVPVDERGKFNAQRWIGGPAKMRELQNSYGQAMAVHGLKRGIEGSVAKHKDIKRMYAQLDQEINIDKDFAKGVLENSIDYEQRVIDEVKTIKAVHVREMNEKDREIVELKSLLKQKHKAETLDEVLDLKKQTHALKKIQEKWAGIEREFGSPDLVRKKIETAQNLNTAMENFPDKKFRDDTLQNLKLMLQWQEDQRQKQKQKEIEKEQKEIK